MKLNSQSTALSVFGKIVTLQAHAHVQWKSRFLKSSFFLKSPDSLNQSQLPSPQSCNTLSLISCTPGISNQFLCLLEVRKKWDSTVLNYYYYWDAAERLLLPSK